MKRTEGTVNLRFSEKEAANGVKFVDKKDNEPRYLVNAKRKAETCAECRCCALGAHRAGRRSVPVSESSGV
jgi:hypothetical protein